MLISALVLGCSGPSKVVGVECSSDADCKLTDVEGRCESTGFCSYPDPACNGNRSTPGATGGLANMCVGSPAGCGEKDQACCANDLCGSDRACTANVDRSRTEWLSVTVSLGPSKPTVWMPGMNPARVELTSIGRV